MNDETANNDTDAGSQETSNEAKAETLFGSDKVEENAEEPKEESKDDAANATDSEEQGDKTDDASESKDEADKEGEESEEGDEKPEASIYDDVVLTEGLPEGTEVNEALVTNAKEIFAKHEVSKEAAQDLINMYNKALVDSETSIQEQWNATEEGWKSDAKADKDIGGDKYDASVTRAQLALAKFGTPELTELFDLTRVGNNVEMIRAWAKVGEAISEDSNFEAGSGAGQRSRASILYDNTKS